MFLSIVSVVSFGPVEVHYTVARWLSLTDKEKKATGFPFATTRSVDLIQSGY